MYGPTSTSTMMLRERFLEGFFYYPIMHVNHPIWMRNIQKKALTNGYAYGTFLIEHISHIIIPAICIS